MEPKFRLRNTVNFHEKFIITLIPWYLSVPIALYRLVQPIFLKPLSDQKVLATLSQLRYIYVYYLVPTTGRRRGGWPGAGPDLLHHRLTSRHTSHPGNTTHSPLTSYLLYCTLPFFLVNCRVSDLNKLNGSKWCSLIRFWGTWKKELLRVLNMIEVFCFVLTVFWAFFHGSGFSGSDPDFLAYPDPDSGKKSDPDPDKRTRIRNTYKLFDPNNIGAPTWISTIAIYDFLA